MISPAEGAATLDTEQPLEFGFSAEPAATVHDMGLLDRDIPFEALLDLSAMVQMALA